MTARRGPILAGLAICAALVLTAVAWATEAFTVTTSFDPDRLGAPTNLSARATFTTGAAAPVPVSDVLAYGPAGLGVDVRGTGSCQRATLETSGPGACPANSRIGFGGGIGLVEIAKELIKEPFTLDLFLGPRENGHLAILIYVNAISPVAVQLVLVAKETHGPKPYGFGFNLEIPPIPTLPGASYAAVESAYITVGSTKVAYYQKVHGRRELSHVKGLVVPKSCPAGGFPFEVTISFLDGSASTDTYTSPCPGR